MNIGLLLFEVCLTLFASITLSYVSMAISIGPWISPTIILISNFILFQITRRDKNNKKKRFDTLFLLQVGPSLAGLVATAIGFMLPALYFLDNEQFSVLQQNTTHFYLIVSATTFFASTWGYLVAKIFYKELANNPENKFSIPTLIANSINNLGTKLQNLFFLGSGSTGILLGLKSTLHRNQWLPTNIFFYPSMVAIGFAMGSSIIISLLSGYGLNYLILPKVFPILKYQFSENSWLAVGNPDIRSFTFTIASGMIIFDLATALCISLFNFFKKTSIFKITEYSTEWESAISSIKKLGKNSNAIKLLALSPVIVFLSRLIKLPLFFTIFTLVVSIPVVLETMKFGASIGLVPFGRFATLAMIPAMLLFKYDPFSIVMLCLFVSVGGAAASSYIFNQKLGELMDVDSKKISASQNKALIIVSILVALVFIFLFKNLELGSTSLFAERGQTRAILVKAMSIDLIGLIVGGILLGIIKFFNLSMALIFSALMMPLQLSLSMLGGGILAKFQKKDQSSDFFFSGVFAGESIFIILSLLISQFLK